MHCKGCNEPIEGDAYRMVAEWPFCVPCFDDLRAGKNRRRDVADPELEESAERVVPAATSKPASGASTDRRCGTCEKPLPPGDASMALGDVLICDACKRALILEPMREIRRKEEEEAAARAAEEAKPRERLSPEDIVPVGLAGNKLCAGCERRLIEPGGYRWVEEKPYCPACAVEAEARLEASPPPAAAGAADPTPGFGSCEACERPFTGARPEPTRGYFLCEPCLDVDAPAAIELARGRHRRRLQSLRGR